MAGIDVFSKSVITPMHGSQLQEAHTAVGETGRKVKCSIRGESGPHYGTSSNLVGFFAGKYLIPVRFFLKFESSSQISVSIFENPPSTGSPRRN